MVTEDLSGGGARFSAISPVALGERVLITVQLGSGQHLLECKGQVRWCFPMHNGLYEFGVRFLDIGLDEQDVVSLHVSRTHDLAACTAV